jgi:hypothetical protein
MRDDEFWMYYQAQPWDGVSLPRQYHDLMIRRAVAPVATPDQWIKDAGAVLSTDAILTQWAAAGCTTTNPTPGSWTFWKRYGPAPSPTAVTLLYRPSAVVVDNAMYLYYGGLNKVDYNDTHFSDRDIGIAFSTRFSDVLPDHWAYKEVEKVAQAGISSGCGNSNFCPDSAITRKEAAAFIAGGAGLPQNDNDPGHYFCDIPQDTFTAPINAAYAAGVADTCGDCAPPSTKKLFCPDATMNRLQLGLWFYRALGLSPSSNNYFSDVPQPEKPMIESLYVAIHTACDVGLYCPNTLATRAMLAAMTADAFLP